MIVSETRYCYCVHTAQQRHPGSASAAPPPPLPVYTITATVPKSTRHTSREQNKLFTDEEMLHVSQLRATTWQHPWNARTWHLSQRCKPAFDDLPLRVAAAQAKPHEQGGTRLCYRAVFVHVCAGLGVGRGGKAVLTSTRLPFLHLDIAA
jgi:hypothetical protein